LAQRWSAVALKSVRTQVIGMDMIGALAVLKWWRIAVPGAGEFFQAAD
jgi:hypothetical protein